MNNRSGGPRSFNTMRHSHRQDRARRRRQGRITLLAICAVSLLLAVSGLILLVCSIATSLGAGQPNPPNGGEGGNLPSSTDITYHLESHEFREIQTGELIVVNNSHGYSFPNVRLENLDAQTKAQYDLLQYRTRVNDAMPYSFDLTKSQLMQPNAAQALNQMLTTYYTSFDDSSVTVVDTYRTEADQQKYSVAPGYSEHHTALIVRLRILSAGNSYKDLSETDHAWLFASCDDYGFIQRYPAAKSGLTGVSNYPECFRYVGVAHASYITENRLCLEEYVELLKNNHSSTTGTDGKHLTIDVNKDGKTDYEVYYVAANSGASSLTTVPVPANFNYTLSGDNIGGFIVTVDLNSPKAS